MNTPTTHIAMAFGLPLNDAIARLKAAASEVNASCEKAAVSKTDDFGAKISEAIKRKLRSRQPMSVGAAADGDEGFADKLTKAVQRKVKDRSRQRPHTAA